MEFGLKGKTAAVTGSAGGIGKAIARALANEGCTVCILDINKQKVEETVEEFKNDGLKVMGRVVDITDSKGVNGFVDEVCKEFGHLDIWVNNAGIYPQKQIVDMTEEEWDRLMSINLKSVFLGVKKASEVMKRQNGGIIINAASFASLLPSSNSGGYAATKAAVLSLTRTLAAELAPWNIRVNAYIPGVIETGMTRQVIDEKGDALVSQIALRRLGVPDDVAKAVVFLASDMASYITGTYLEVSGGKFCVQNPDYTWKLKGV